VMYIVGNEQRAFHDYDVYFVQGYHSCNTAVMICNW